MRDSPPPINEEYVLLTYPKPNGSIVDIPMTFVFVSMKAYGNLKPLSLGVKENELLTREMIWNAAFLVELSMEEKFDDRSTGGTLRNGSILRGRLSWSTLY